MISVLLATGFETLDNTLEKFFNKHQDISILKQKVYFREGLSDTIIRNDPNLVIISDRLEGNSISLEQMVRTIRKRHPETRMIFILSNYDNIKLRKFLYQLNIFDVFSLDPKLNVKELHESFYQPKEWKDVAKYFPDDEESFDLDQDYILNEEDGLIIENDYTTVDAKFKHNASGTLARYAAIWSPRQQSGTTFLAINTALLLAQHTDQKILLLDFNPNNPNIHLQFGLEDRDGNRNLGALTEDVESRRISRAPDIDDYLITHPYYSNIRVMPGLILKNKKPSQELLIKTFEIIYQYAANEGFTSIIFDIESGLEEAHIIEILKKVDVIITPITESPGNIIATQKLFDREHGAFYLNFLDLKKVFPVLNKSSNTQITNKIQQILQSQLRRNIEAIIPFEESIHYSVQSSNPLLKTQPDPDIMRSLSIITNYIQNILAIETENSTPKTKRDKKRFGLF